MVNNDNVEINGELFFYSFMEDNLSLIFDVGCRNDSLFKNFYGTVHYFDPAQDAIETLKKQPSSNKKSYFNNIALSDKTGELFFYPKYQSLHNRIKTCKIDDDKNKKIVPVMTGYDYIKANNINNIDFLKIDVEGHEFSVIKGFGEAISKVSIIQFEYGGTFIDTNIKLIDIKDHLNGIFDKFYYLTTDRLIPITNFKDHYNYCNIICFNNNYEYTNYKDLIYE